MTFSNLPTGMPLGFNSLLAHFDNITNHRYTFDPETDPIISALDITWCGAQLPNSSDNGGNKEINTTEELLTLVNEMNKRLYALTAAVIALSNK